jgi:peptidoglycan/xylan/chitin deacetylase (PgdA/CDA1 family)
MSSMLERVRGRVQRTLAHRSFRRPMRISPPQPIVSFTFDDFPRSALLEAGAVLHSFGWQGTYYASFRLIGKTAPTGEIFTADDLPEFIRQGHELACHTFDHCHSWDTTPSEFEASIVRNQQAVAKLLPGLELRTFSYPISGPRPLTKRNIAKYYSCARGGGQTYNAGEVDLSLLQAFFIEQSRDDLDAIKRVIDETVAAKGWLILATHDVTASPTRFGCTPDFFRKIAEYVAHSGAVVQPVWDALQSVKPSDVSELVSQH